MSDRLESMVVFVRVAKLGFFTKAGAALGLTSQTVGRHVAELQRGSAPSSWHARRGARA